MKVEVGQRVRVNGAWVRGVGVVEQLIEMWPSRCAVRVERYDGVDHGPGRWVFSPLELAPLTARDAFPPATEGGRDGT
jgi:hypothetical protein